MPVEDVHITVEDNVVLIEGELCEEPAQPPQQPTNSQPNGHQVQPAGSAPRVHHRERRYGRFSRQVVLPASIDAGKTQATFEYGVLTLTLPKAEQAKRHQIAITETGKVQQLPQARTAAAARQPRCAPIRPIRRKGRSGQLSGPFLFTPLVRGIGLHCSRIHQGGS